MFDASAIGRLELVILLAQEPLSGSSSSGTRTASLPSSEDAVRRACGTSSAATRRLSLLLAAVIGPVVEADAQCLALLLGDAWLWEARTAVGGAGRRHAASTRCARPPLALVLTRMVSGAGWSHSSTA